MFEMTNDSQAYRRVGFGLLFLQLALFALGFPPFHYGIWVQVEPVLLVMFLYGYLTSAWLAVGIAKNWLVPQPNAPLWVVLVAWLGWQFIPTLLATTPWRSWFGPPELGEGVAWHVATTLMVMLAYPLLRVPSYRRILVIAAVIFIGLQAVLHVYSPRDEMANNLGFNSDRWVATRFPKDLPFMAGYLWIFMTCWRQLKARVWQVSYLLFFMGVLWVSNNRTAIAMLGGAMLISTIVPLLRGRRLQRWLYPSRAWRIAALVACILPFSWIVFSINIGTLGSLFSPPEMAGNGAIVHAEFGINNKDGAIGGRVPIIQVGWEAMKHEPIRWLVGDGWGRFTDDMYKYALVDGIYAYKNGEHKPNWTSLQEVPIVHSHCQPMEALLSLGLPGLVLWLLVPMVGIWCVPKRFFWGVAPMIIAINGISFFWFELIQEMPFRALVLASLCRFSTAHVRINLHRKPDVTVLLLTCACLAMGWSVWQQRTAILYSQQIRVALLSVTDKDYKEEWLLEDSKRGGDRLRETALMYELSLANTIKWQPADEIDRGWYRLYLKATHDYANAPSSTARAASTELWLMYKIFGELSFPSFAPLKPEVFSGIPDAILYVTRRAPLRDDMAATFLANLPKFTNDDTSQQLDFLHKILEIAPNHRGALWVLGKMLHDMPSHEAEGEAMMRKAVSLGVERVYPVTDEQIAPYK